MTVAGVITEYNPFHNGHRYQLQEIRKVFPDSPLVVAMSGNFLQRGEPAILDKWHRAEEVLLDEANLVIEMPVLACVQPADRFAQYGVRALVQMGVTDLFFGVEHDNFDFEKIALIVRELHGDFNNYKQSYAATYQQAIKQKLGYNVDQPNDLLGLAYAKANLDIGSPLKLHPIKRVNNNYHDTNLPAKSTIASATAIRENIENKKILSSYVPTQTYEHLLNQKTVSWSDMWSYLRYRLLTDDINELGKIYGMAEGIEYRLQDKIRRNVSASFTEWMSDVKNKRFTYTRLSRLAVYILLNIRDEDVINFQQNPYLRLLGFDKIGQDLLKQRKKLLDFDLYSNVHADDIKQRLRVDYNAGKLYQLITGQEQDLKKAPLRIFGKGVKEKTLTKGTD